ncbi:uncharacterized protein SCHCODRAFT_02752362 [Schizophyllum commune H4-8]|nr:uncharacterized protein SCHCODRAFT_02752362 [Schizophyllum commune H4-8]KAI5888069.1 hypothetical protein SCHCODRAFT_02752362 [Schizophyllum commune H4-8]
MFDQSTVDSPRLESEEDSDQQSLKERLVSFDPPLLQDELFIKPHHVRAEGEINEYSAEIDCGSAPMHALIEERNELESICAASVSMCNSISHLVPDVLGEIFCFVRDEAKYSLSDAHSYVLPLAQTCRQWRSIAFYQPSLWAYINVSYVDKSWLESDYDERVARAVRYHLDKSGEAPLSVHILNITSPACRELFTELCRWRECDINGVPTAEAAPQARAPLYPSLERLAFIRTAGTNHFECAPLLRTYLGPITEMRLPWAQLTSLTVTSGTAPHSRHLIDTLVTCKDLEYLSLEYASFDAPTPADTSSPTPVLPRLRALRLLSSYERIAITELRILALIDAPALDSFEICISSTDSRCNSPDALPDVVVGILTRFRALRILSLKGTPLDRHGLRRVLASAPSVERLVWWEIEELGHSNFAALADALSSSSLASNASAGADDHPTTDVVHTILPRLSHLEVSGGLTPADPRQIAGLIRSRAVKGDGPSDAATLRAVVLEYLSACNLEPRTLSELRRELDSFIIRENISQGRGVFSYQVEYEDEDPPYSISYFD